MDLEFVINYFLDSHKKLCKISQEGAGNILYLWYDFLKCSIVHGTIKDVLVDFIHPNASLGIQIYSRAVARL